MAEQYSVVGTDIVDNHGFDRVTGTGQFSTDFYTPDMLHLKSLRSPHAHANIVSIDTSEAETSPGVKLVMTYENFPKVLFQDIHFVGQEIACVVAETEKQAREAVRLIKVEYEVLPFVIDPEEAMKEGAPQAYQGQPNLQKWPQHALFSDKNEQGLFTKRTLGAEFDGFGDVEQGRLESEITVEDEGYKYALQHAPLMEPSCAYVKFNDGKITIAYANQNGFADRLTIAKTFGLPMNKIEVLSPLAGGSFGSRLNTPVAPATRAGSYVPIAVAASIALGRTIRYSFSRQEEMLQRWGRGTFDSKLAIGFKNDGTMVFMDSKVWRNVTTGAILPMGFDASPTGTILYSHNCKHSSHIKYNVYTNSPGYCGWQGFSNPEVFHLVESTMDVAAEKLNMDPIELRKINHMREGDNYLQLTYMFTGPCYLSQSGISECLDIGAEKVGWSSRQLPGEKTGRIRHGLGVALIAQQTGGDGMHSEALVKLQADGSAFLINNYTDLGQGGRTKERIVAAETLGLPYDKVTIVAGSTDFTPWTCWQACSSGTRTSGFAVYNAAMDAKNKLLAAAAPLLNASPEDLDTKNGMIFLKSDETKAIPWIAAFQNVAPYAMLGDIIGYHMHHITKGATPSEKGATFASLDVDTETGQLLNIKITHCQNCGKALFPRAVEGVYQSIHHAVDAMVGAEMILDPSTGKLLTDNWIDYPVATILDSVVDPVIVEMPGDVTHPYGASGIGQANQNGVSAAIGNAIYNAIGVRLKETPYTPEKILKALGKI